MEKHEMSSTLPFTNQNSHENCEKPLKITTRNKLLIISEDFYDNLRFQHIQIAQIVDECAEDLRSCNKDNTICSNTVGSFKCFSEPGFIRDGHSCRGKILYNEH